MPTGTAEEGEAAAAARRKQEATEAKEAAPAGFAAEAAEEALPAAAAAQWDQEAKEVAPAGAAAAAAEEAVPAVAAAQWDQEVEEAQATPAGAAAEAAEEAVPAAAAAHWDQGAKEAAPAGTSAKAAEEAALAAAAAQRDPEANEVVPAGEAEETAAAAEEVETVPGAHWEPEAKAGEAKDAAAQEEDLAATNSSNAESWVTVPATPREATAAQRQPSPPPKAQPATPMAVPDEIPGPSCTPSVVDIRPPQWASEPAVLTTPRGRNKARRGREQRGGGARGWRRSCVSQSGSNKRRRTAHKKRGCAGALGSFIAPGKPGWPTKAIISERPSSRPGFPWPAPWTRAWHRLACPKRAGCRKWRAGWIQE
jgi:hypothetical protein